MRSIVSGIIRSRRQRGITLVELLVVISILGMIAPCLALIVTQLIKVPQTASAALMTSYDASRATEMITCDAANADTWNTEPNPLPNPNNYGTFTWFDADGKSHIVLYKYDNGSLVRQETIDGVPGNDAVIASGLGSMSDLSFSQVSGEDFVTVTMTVAQKDGDSTPVAAQRTFVAWLRMGAANMDKWGYRREIVIDYPGENRLTNYPMLLDLTGAPLNWNIQSEIDSYRMLTDGADIRFVRLAGVYELPIIITGGTTVANYALRVVIDSQDSIGDDAADQVVLNHMAPNYTGSDIRFFSQAVVANGDIYNSSSANKLPFWIQERSDTRLIAWVNVPTVGTTGIFMYYGDPMKTSESSLANTFNAETFTDPFNNGSLIDAAQSSHYVVSGGQVGINLASTSLNNPSFELNNTAWTADASQHVSFHADKYNTDSATGWPTNGTHSAKLSGDRYDDSSAPSASLGMYDQIYQGSVNLTDVSSITFDAKLLALYSGVYQAQFLVDGTVLWSADLPQLATVISPTVDVSRYTGAGHTLTFRIIVIKCNSWIDSFTCYFDNVRTTQYAKVASVAFPSGALARFAGGNQLSWIKTTPASTSILYRLQGYDGAAWENIPDSLLPGNTAGLSTSPVNFSNITLASGYEGYQKIRLVAYLYTMNDAVTPTIDSWTATYFDRQCVATAQGAAQFTDSFDGWTRIDSSQSSHIVVNNGQAQIAGVVADPSFELNSGSWIEGTTAADKLNTDAFSTDSATGWPTNGTHSAKLWSLSFRPDPNGNPHSTPTTMGYIAEVSQSVDLTYVTNIYFDARLSLSGGAGDYRAEALIDGNILWQQAIPTTATNYLNRSISTSAYTGTHTLVFRVKVYAQPTGNRVFTAYFDNVGVNTWAKVTSAAFPGTTGDFVQGTQISWNNSVPANTQIKYQLQGFNGTAWVLVPDSILLGNAAGFQMSPVNISAVTAAGGYQQLRLVATLSNNNDLLYSSPAIQDWTVTFVVNDATVDRSTAYVLSQEFKKYDARYEMLRFFLNPNDHVDGTNPNDGVWDPANNNVRLWVVLSDIPVGKSSIYVYYGNRNAGTAGFPSGHPGTLRDAIGDPFFDTFNDWSMIDTTASQHIMVSSGQVQVARGDSVVANPSFENSTAWLLYADDDDMQPSYSTAWRTLGSQSLRLRTLATGGLIVYQGNIVEGRQLVDMTNIHTISFDCRLRQDTSGIYSASVMVDNTVVWGPTNLPTSATTYTGQTIDMHNFPAVSTGTHILRFRVTVVPAGDTSNQNFDSYWDNIVTKGYSAYGDIHLVSVSIPLAEALKMVSQCFMVDWTDSCTTLQDVIYQLQWTQNLVTPNWQPIPANFFTCGNNNLWTGEATLNALGQPTTMPAELINTSQTWSANYRYLRLWSQLRVNNINDATGASWPKILDWALLSGKQLSSNTPTVFGGWGPLISGESVGTGNGSQTQFPLAHKPVAAGTATIYLSGVKQVAGYTMDLANGIITFTSAPGNGVSITADYLWNKGQETWGKALPLSVYGEAVGTGNGVQTQFTLIHRPVVQGSEIIYLDGVPTAQLGVSYTLDLATGVITFASAPSNLVNITADYLYDHT